MSSYLNIAAIRECTESEGPGRRFAIWCQGCFRNCKGCCNPEMQPFIERTIVDPDDLKEKILLSKERNCIEGVSFIGGEPALQAEGFSVLAEWCQRVGLSVLMFSGFLHSELVEMHNPFVDRLLSNLDILIDGPFIQSMLDHERDWVGSTNQQVYFFTSRYASGIEKAKGKRSVECFISDTSIKVNGWPIDIK